MEDRNLSFLERFFFRFQTLQTRARTLARMANPPPPPTHTHTHTNVDILVAISHYHYRHGLAALFWGAFQDFRYVWKRCNVSDFYKSELPCYAVPFNPDPYIDPGLSECHSLYYCFLLISVQNGSVGRGGDLV